jgi:DNA-binding transcriptional regulator YiaG
MQEVIKNSNMTIKEFSNYYEIPYNTVREWYNGNRKAPNWVVKLFKENAKLKTNGKQLNLFN